MLQKIIRSAALAVVAVALSGCGSLSKIAQIFSFSSSPANIAFIDNVPEPVSAAWRDVHGDVWMVPKRGVLIEQIQGATHWAAQGSYVVAKGNPQHLKILSGGQWWNFSVAF